MTCTQAPTPRLGGIAMLIGLVAAVAVASSCRSCPASCSRTPVTPGRCWPAVADLPARRGGRPLGAGRAHQVRRPGAGRRRDGGDGHPDDLLPIPGTTIVLDSSSGTLLSVLIVVATVNAVNFVDGLDGLLAGIALTAALAFFTYTYLLWPCIRASTARSLRRCSPRCWPASAWASCRTTSSRRGSSWGTPAPC